MILNISTRDGKTYKLEIAEEKKALLLGRKIGDEIDGGSLGLPGYSLKITGASDSSGFPLRQDIQGTRKVKVLLSGGVGYRPKRKGERRRKTVRGNTIAEDVVQVNTKVVRYGAEPLENLLGQKKEAE